MSAQFDRKSAPAPTFSPVLEDIFTRIDNINNKNNEPSHQDSSNSQNEKETQEFSGYNPEQLNIFFQQWNELMNEDWDEDSKPNEWKWMDDVQSLLLKTKFALNDAAEKLVKLRQQKEEVQKNVDGLYSACHSLLDEKKIYENTITIIKGKLSNYTRYEGIKKRLNSTPILNDISELKKTMIKIDDSIDFFHIHNDYFSAKQYHDDYKALRTLIYNSISTSIHQFMSNFHSSNEFDDSTHYDTFKKEGSAIKPLTEFLGSRAQATLSPFYFSGLDSLENHFIGMRIRIIQTPLTNTLKSKHNQTNKLGVSIRELTKYMISICQLELSLFTHFFPHPHQNNNAKNLLKRLGDIYYEVLKPAINSNKSIEDLRKAANCLSLDILDPTHTQSPESLSSFYSIVFQAQKDILDRLVFIFGIFIQRKIFNYSPSARDLAYPEILHTQPSSDPSLRWYPTLRRSLLALSKVHRMLDVHTFKQLADETLDVCVYTLQVASDEIAKIEGKALDAQLFLIRHIVILKEQISAFDLHFDVTHFGFDTHTLQGNLLSLLFGPPSTNPRSNKIKNATHKNIEQVLKSTCENYVILSTNELTQPLISLTKEILKNKTLDELKSLAKTAFEQFHENLEILLNKLLAKMHLYLLEPDDETTTKALIVNEKVDILFHPIKLNILSSAENIEKYVLKEFEFNYDDFKEVGWEGVAHINQKIMLALSKMEKYSNQSADQFYTHTHTHLHTPNTMDLPIHTQIDGPNYTHTDSIKIDEDELLSSDEIIEFLA